MPGWKKQQNELNVQHQHLVFEPRMICWGMICCFFVALLDKRVISEASDRLHQLSSPIQTPVQPHAKSHTPTHTPTNKEPNLKYYHWWRKPTTGKGGVGGLQVGCSLLQCLMYRMICCCGNGGWGHASCSSAVWEGNGRVITAVLFYKTTYTLANWTHPATCKMQRTGCFHIVKSW